jgi:putative ubiquitin-RnfH superfamily antitoxin RatB of RatAB toxin-antitoxin module
MAPSMQEGIAIELVVTDTQPKLNLATRHWLALPVAMTIEELQLWLSSQNVKDLQGLAEAFKSAAGFAIFGKAVAANTCLHQGDRLELLGPLLADPKLARRQRVQTRRVEQAGKGQFDRWTRNR